MERVGMLFLFFHRPSSETANDAECDTVVGSECVKINNNLLQ